MERSVIALCVGAAVMVFSSGCCEGGATSLPAWELLKQINARRTAAGCSEVLGSDQLRLAAERHASDMRDHPAIRNDPNHLGSDGSTPQQRIAEAGFTPASRTGEIMYWASGPPGNTVEATLNWWMNSPSHRDIIEDCEFTHAGVGLFYPQGREWYATVDFGRH